MNEASGDVPTVRGAIQAIQPSDGRGSYAELARSLRSIAQSAHMPVEAHLFSDMQKSSWPSNFADARLSEGTKLVFHRYGDRYFLAQIWVAGNNSGSELPKSPREVEVAQDPGFWRFEHGLESLAPKFSEAGAGCIRDRDVKARQIPVDQQLSLGKYINPKGKVLKNSDEPATIFEVSVVSDGSS